MKKDDFRASLKLYKRVLAFGRPYVSLFVLSIVLSLLIVTAEAIYLWVPASLVKTLFEPDVGPITRPAFSLGTLNEVLKYWTYQTVKSTDPFVTLKLICGLLVVACTLKNILAYLQSLVINKLNLVIIRDMRDTIYHHVLMLPMSFFARNRSGNIVSKILNDVGQVNQAITMVFQRVLIEPLRLFVFLALLFVISTRLTLIVLLIYPVLAYLILKIGQSVRRRSRRMLDNLSGMVAVLNETIGGLRAVKMFNMNMTESRKFREENEKYVKAAFRSIRMSVAISPLTETLGAMVTGVLLWYGGRQVLHPDGAFSAEDFLRFLFLLISSYRPLKAMGEINVALQGGMAAADRICETLDERTEPLKPFDSRKVPPFEKGLVFDHVTFSYPGYEKEVLKDVSFNIDKGKIVALVGPSGSGKSTILDCIPRFYEAEKGRILADGRDVRTFDLVGYRHLFGVVSQETILFNDTVFNNIAYGVQSATLDDVIKVAQGANAWEFIQELPQGLDTVVGERGVTLSGGQRQRVAIARALLRNPPILILDEAMSALDTESERQVQKAIDALMKGRTAVVVAHRLSTIRHADLILVIEEGRIVEQGTHEELLARNERYRTVYDLQFDRKEFAD